MASIRVNGVQVGGGGGSGVAVDPIFQLLGTPNDAFEFDTTSLSGLTAMGTPDTEAAQSIIPSHLVYEDNASGVAWCGRYVAKSAPFTGIIKVTDANMIAQINSAAVFVGQATPGIFEEVGYHSLGGGVRIAHHRYTNPTTFEGTETLGPIGLMIPLWFAARVNSTTDVDFLYSYNGYLWTKLVDSRNPSITVGSVGVAFKSQNAAGGTAAFEYLRIWNTAKTLPGVAA